MKTTIKLSVLILVVATQLACQEKPDTKTSVGTRSTRGTPTGIGGLPGVGTSTGAATPKGTADFGPIYGGNVWNDYDFNDIVHQFVNLGSDLFGTVSGQLNQSTGIRFFAYVDYSGNQVVAANSVLRMVIWDSYAGQINPSTGKPITEFALDIAGRASGEVNNTYARVRFTDNAGFVEFYGPISQGYFSGEVWFDNTDGAANKLGAFYIPICSFFRC